MPYIDLLQAEADALIAMNKVAIDDKKINYPNSGNNVILPLISEDNREKFTLDINRGRIDLLKGTYQNRARQVVVLVRLDFGGRPHRNPDGQEIDSPHLHIFREGYGDKWATSLPPEKFLNVSDLMHLLDDFMRFCNIIKPPRIERGLFE